MMTNFTLFTTSIGECGIVWRYNTVAGTYLPDEAPSKTARKIAKKFRAVPGDPPACIQRALNAMTSLLAGDRSDLGFINCDFTTMPPFEAKVYAATRAIPMGETRTYGDIAERVGNKNLARQVGRALGRNPFPVIVPCHRVVRTSGKLTGFSAPGGIDTKLKMLSIEKTSIGKRDGLFDNLPLSLKPRT